MIREANLFIVTGFTAVEPAVDNDLSRKRDYAIDIWNCFASAPDERVTPTMYVWSNISLKAFQNLEHSTQENGMKSACICIHIEMFLVNEIT